MSNSVDQRIVQMQFDNAQFERGVGTTLASLKALDQGLQFKNGVTGLTDVDAAASRLNFSGLVSDVSDLNDKLSALGVIGFTALSRLTNSLMDFGTGAVKALTVDPLTDGLDEYKLKMDSITTIMSNTKSKGTTLDEVNETLAELNLYADQTIYNFAEMTRNIGTFTAAGVDLKTSASAIKGIANLAAVSGSNSQQASVAMYQLSQALASGTVKLMDWNSVLNAGMGGQVFQDALIRTSEHLGTGAKAAIEAEGSFRESLKQGWLTSEVLTETLNQFTMLGSEKERQHLQELGYTEEEIAAVFEMGKTATDAATKVKTFQQLIDTTKEALGSGWATSWEYIIGNMEQAQELWTGISIAINGVIDALSNPRNEFLKTWNEQGGWEALKDTLFEIGGLLTDLLQPLADAFDRVFSDILDPIKGGSAAAEASKSLLALVQSIRNFIETSETARVVSFVLRTAFTVLFEAIKLVVGIVGGAFVTAFKVVGAVLETAVKAVEFVISTIKSLSSAIASFALDNIFEPLSRFVTEALKLESVGKLIHDLGGMFGVFFDILAHGHTDLADKTKDMFTGLVNEDIARIAERVGSALRTFAEGLSHVFDAVKGAASIGAVAIFDKLQTVWEHVLPILENVRGKLASAWDTLKDAFVSSGLSLDPFIEMFQGFGESFGQFFESVFSEGFSLDKVFDLFKNLGSNVQTFMSELGPSVSSFVSSISSAIGGDFSGVLSTVMGWLSSLGGPISAIVDGLAKLIGSFTSLDGSFTLSLDSMGEGGIALSNTVKNVLSTVKEFGGAIAAIKDPFGAISNVISSGLSGLAGGLNSFIESLNTPEIGALLEKISGLAVLGGVGAGLYEFFQLIKSVSGLLNSWEHLCTSIADGLDKLDDALAAAKTALYASVLVSVAVSIGILVASLYALTQMDMDRVNEALPVLAKIAAGLIIVVLAFSVAARIAKANAASIMAMSGVIMSIIAALFAMVAMTTILGLIPEGVVEQGEAALAGIVRMLTLLIVAIGVVAKASASSASAIGMISQLALAISLLAGIVVVLGVIPEGILLKGLIVVGVLAVILGVLSAAVSRFGKGALASASGLMEMAVAIAILAGAITVLSAADTVKMLAATAAVAGLILVFGLFLTITDKINPILFTETATSLILFSVAVGILAAALAGLAAVSAMGGDLFGAGVALVAMLLALSVAALALGTAGPLMIEGAQAMLIVAGAVALLSAALIALSMIQSEDSWRALGQLALVMLALSVAFAAVAFVATVLEPGLYALTAVLLGLAAVLIGFGAGALMFATAVTTLSQLTPASVDRMIEAFQRLCVGLWESKEEIAMAVAGIGMAISAGILAAIPGIIAVLLGLVGAIIAVLVAAGPILGMGAVQMVAGIIDGFATGLEEHGQDIVDALKHLAQVVMDGIWQAIVDGVNEFNNWLYDATGGLLGKKTEEAASALASRTTDSYANALRDGKDNVGKAATEYKDAAMEQFNQGSEEASKSASDLMGMLEDTLGVKIPVGEGGYDLSSLEAAGIDVESLCAMTGMDGADELLAMMNATLDNGSIDMSSVTEDAKEQMSEGGEESVAAFVESSESKASSVDMSGAFTSMMATAVDVEAIAQQGVAAASATSTSYSENVNFDVSPAIKTATSILNNPKAFLAAGEADGAAATEGVSLGISKMSSTAKTAMNSALNSVSSLTGQARDKSYPVGTALSSGVASGVNAAAWRVTSAASSLISTAVSAMRRAGIIKSPSKLTKEIGKYMAEGFAIGMTDNVGMTDKAARDLVESSLDSMLTQAGYLMGLLDNIDDQPVITPVLDLSQVESGVGAFDGLFSRGQFVSASAIQQDLGFINSRGSGSNVRYGDQYQFNLQYDAGADATDIVRGMARSMRTRTLLEG